MIYFIIGLQNVAKYDNIYIARGTSLTLTENGLFVYAGHFLFILHRMAI